MNFEEEAVARRFGASSSRWRQRSLAAESELCAGPRAASEGFGVQSIGVDLGRLCDVILYMDRSAALSLVSKVGLGRAKHNEMQHLWLWLAVKDKQLSVAKINSEIKPADLLTNGLSAEKRERLLRIVSRKADVR